MVDDWKIIASEQSSTGTRLNYRDMELSRWTSWRAISADPCGGKLRCGEAIGAKSAQSDAVVEHCAGVWFA